MTRDKNGSCWPGHRSRRRRAAGCCLALPAEPVERAWVAGLAPERLRGSAFGFYHGTIGLTALPASLIFGGIYAWAGSGVAFATGAALAGIALMLLLTVPELPRAVSIE